MRLLLISFFIFSFLISSAQDAPFERGINLTGWFQAASPRQIQFSKYDKIDFEQIKSLGCDVIRLPINLHFMTDGAPDYHLNPLFLEFLDQTVEWSEELGLHLIFDNHTFSPSENTDPNIGDVLEKVWLQMATHYKDAYENIYYEVLNEPHGISDFLWNNIQQDIVEIIRTVDVEHTIIVGGAGWNSYNNLAAMPEYEDDNLIYTFHFYDPFIFTHQGATWTGPSMGSLQDIPFPYEAERMPNLPSDLLGTWVQFNHLAYPSQGNVDFVKELIDIAVQFREERGVPVFCGEFGVYQPNSQEPDRVFWYDAVRSYLEAQEIPWTIWDYHGGFGIFREDGNDLFEHDLNTELLEALGWNIPEQTPFVPYEDTVGFAIYTDFIEKGLFENSFGSGRLDYYSARQPQVGQRCIEWSNPNQYDAIGLDLRPNKDMGYLVEEGFILDFYVRGNTSNTSFDIRFLDTDTGEDDHPWRMRFTVDDTTVDWNGEWQQVQIPLSSFTEHGAWENEWFNPIGAFDWTAVDRFEIVAEQGGLENKSLSFDQILLTFAESTATEIQLQLTGIQLSPNPASEQLQLQTELNESLQYELVDNVGRTVKKGTFKGQHYLELTNVASGVYFLRVWGVERDFVVEKVLVE